MTSELFTFALRANLAASGAIIGVALVRPRIRRTFGPRITSWLWSVPFVAALASVIPRYDLHAHLTLSQRHPASQLEQMVFTVWLLGVLLATAYVTTLQLLFMRDEREGRAGPAAVGLICPRIVMPRSASFSAEERKLVRLHEQEHIRFKDPMVRALITLFQCLCWFNPVIHLAASAVRLDQELACDAEVVRQFTKHRRTYAEALLMNLRVEHASVGCHWIPASRHPLETRIAALKSSGHREARGSWGLALVVSLTLASGILTWKIVPATRPPQLFVWPSDPPIVALIEIVPRNRSDGNLKTPEALPSQ